MMDTPSFQIEGTPARHKEGTPDFPKEGAPGCHIEGTKGLYLLFRAPEADFTQRSTRSTLISTSTCSLPASLP